jgi:tetratricopeptide (TPR) repeat protein
MRAFLGEKGSLIVPICKSLSIDFSTDLQTATEDALQRAKGLIKAKQADLLLFGDVRKPDDAVMIYAMNEHGGCDLHPKPTIIEHGDLPRDFSDKQKKNLIFVSLKEIQSACLNQSSMDWPLFAKRMNKMELFLKYFNFSQPRSLYLAGSYIEAMRLLYHSGQGDIWFSKGEEFAKREINKDHAKDQETSKGLSSLYIEYAILRGTKFYNTKDKHDQDAAIDALTKAIDLDPKGAGAYRLRGDAFSDKHEWDRAIEDFTKAIDLDPKDALGYNNRGRAYAKKGDWDRAIEDFTKAIGLNPKLGLTYNFRGGVYARKREWDRAIEDFSEAISLDPNSAESYELRGEA